MQKETDAFYKGPYGVVGFLRYARPRQIFGLLLFLFAVGIAAAVEFVLRVSFLFEEMTGRPMPADLQMQFTAGPYLLGSIAVIALLLATRFGAPTARQRIALQKDVPPVVYLRSFLDDRTPFGQPSTEEVFSEVFSSIGPVVGIGRPGEMLPTAGAARMTSDDDTWQEKVSDLLSRASAVIVQMGKTKGLMWEMSEIAKRCDPRRVVIFSSPYLPPIESAELAASFAKNVEQSKALPGRLPAEQLITFDAEWAAKGRDLPPGNSLAKILLWVIWILPNLVLILIMWVSASRDPTFTAGMVGLFTVVLVFYAFLPLVLLRPLEKNFAAARYGKELHGFYMASGLASEPGRPFGRLAVATAALFGAFACLPLIAFNAWGAGQRRFAIICLAAAPLCFFHPVLTIPGTPELPLTVFSPFAGLDFAFLVFVTWSLYTPRSVERHLTFGGARASRWICAAVLILGAVCALFAMPFGFSLSPS